MSDEQKPCRFRLCPRGEDSILGVYGCPHCEAGLSGQRRMELVCTCKLGLPDASPEPQPETHAQKARREAHEHWQPGRWFRIFRPDGRLWMETSDGEEARAEAIKTGWPLERQWISNCSEWRIEPTAAARQPSTEKSE